MQFVTNLFVASPAVLDMASLENKVSERFEALRNNLPELKILIGRMPKGGELHIHMLGSIYAEKLLNLAVKHSLFYNTTTGLFTNLESPGTVPASEVEANSSYLNQYLNNVSMRGSSVCGGLPHDHFMYTCFGVIESVTSLINPVELIEFVREEFRRQNIRYAEMMVGLSTLNTLSTHFEELGQKTPKIKFIVELSRLQSDDTVFESQVKESIQLMTQYPEHVYTFNIVGPEDNPIAQTHFAKQIEIIDRLWKERNFPGTLHAGELTPLFSSPHYMKNKISETLKKGHCRRIGHGVSIPYEEDPDALMKLMEEQKTCMEICLTSNEKILNVSGKEHPIRFYAKRVPITLNSDDPAVNREDLNAQFLKAMIDHGFTYKDLKQFARNSLEYSFMPGYSIFDNGKLRSEAPILVHSSEKSYEQFELEKEFTAFEKSIVG